VIAYLHFPLSFFHLNKVLLIFWSGTYIENVTTSYLILAIAAAFEANELIREFQESKGDILSGEYVMIKYLVNTDTANSIIRISTICLY
jgi:hypothetical protein